MANEDVSPLCWCEHSQADHHDGEDCRVILQDGSICECTRYQPIEHMFDVPGQRLLSIQEVRRLGALQVEETMRYQSQVFLDKQRDEYNRHPHEDLVEELLRRDENALREGRGLADGRVAGNLLREFVRGILQTADTAKLRRMEGFARDRKIQDILELLGAGPIDNRQLRLEGSGLGQVNEETPATYPRPDVAESIREQRAAKVAEDLNKLLDETPRK